VLFRDFRVFSGPSGCDRLRPRKTQKIAEHTERLNSRERLLWFAKPKDIPVSSALLYERHFAS
jgi:hypothetical protein